MQLKLEQGDAPEISAAAADHPEAAEQGNRRMWDWKRLTAPER